ncbi:TlpA family protein disulfide reductase [Actinotalea sp.]|uniref:TlpA family protein disulfide reductase n=1 Tax=Actinotalea sp. TaxID=1872145 RepID=UPI00356603C1
MVLAIAVVVVAVLALSSLAGCVSTAGLTDDGEDAGYVSGDASVTTWDQGARPGPIDLVGTDYAGEPVDSSAWIGEVVLINTWYAACPPCRAEAPDLAEIAREYAEQGVQTIGVNFTDEAGAAQAFERTFDLPYPSIQDTDGSAVASLQGTVPVQAVPTTVLLDRDGLVAARILGTADPSTLRTLLDELLAESA